MSVCSQSYTHMEQSELSSYSNEWHYTKKMEISVDQLCNVQIQCQPVHYQLDIMISVDNDSILEYTKPAHHQYT